jgi:signal transduction histidine kinase
MLFSDKGLSGPQRELGERIGELVERIRRMSHRVQPPVHPEAGLSEALAGLCRDADAVSGVAIAFSARGDVDVVGEEALQLRRIAQEALSNAIGHGRPTSIEVNLDLGSRAAILSVSDDGCGFDLSVVRAGLGMQSMHDRAQAIGAALEVRTRPGRGTTLRVELPRSRNFPADAGK